MRLNRLSLSGWRNLEALELDLTSRFVLVWGENGAGKTSLLEAVAVLATLRSFRTPGWGEVIRMGATGASVSGEVSGDAGTYRLALQLGRESGGNVTRRLFLDGQQVRDVSSYFQRVRAVVFSPEDVGVVRGAPEERRRFMDRAAFNVWPHHLEHARVFRRVLQQKATLLKQGGVARRELEAWNERLAPAGAALSLGRRRAVETLARFVPDVHRRLAGEGEAVIKYKGALTGDSLGELESGYRSLLRRVMEDEIRRGMNLVGPQRDDLQICYRPGHGSGELRSARSFGSQGQVRTIAMTMKLSELAMAEEAGDPPILLLDDLSSELDEGRQERLLRFLETMEAQVLVSTTDPGPLERAARQPVQAVRLREGQVA